MCLKITATKTATITRYLPKHSGPAYTAWVENAAASDWDTTCTTVQVEEFTPDRPAQNIPGFYAPVPKPVHLRFLAEVAEGTGQYMGTDAERILSQRYLPEDLPYILIGLAPLMERHLSDRGRLYFDREYSSEGLLVELVAGIAERILESLGIIGEDRYGNQTTDWEKWEENFG